VIIDVRNSYEAEIGHFQPPPNGYTAMKLTICSGAQYMDPKMRVSTEFPAWVEANKAKLESADQIMMFCTGGIRCERASALLKEKGVDKPIFQMKGGIHRYLEDFKEDGGHWKVSKENGADG
jgi:predicted sulfurtransferase